MLFCYEKVEDAIRVLFDMACEPVIPDARLLLRFCDEDWGLCDPYHMPSWDEFAMHIRYGTLTACILTTATTRGLRVCWDIDNIGGSILRWESEPPADEVRRNLYERLIKRLKQEAVMAVNET